MKDLLRSAFCLAFVAVLAAPALAAPKVAPADEYFGKMKISALGIDNMIRDTDVRESYDPNEASRLYGALMNAEDALLDWASKYPQDSWIPKRAYLLSHLFWRMNTPEATAAADKCRGVIFKYFPSNHYAVLAKSETASSYVASLTSSTAAIASPSPQPAPTTK